MQTLRKKTSPCKYKNEPSRFLGDGVSFRAKLIGILEVGEARGERMCQEALADLKMAVRAAGEHKQRIVVCVAIDGLRLRDDKTGDCLYHHPVHKISFIAQDMTDSRAFGYIFGSPDTGHRFFGIKTDKAASQVVIAMRDLFQVVFELKKKEIEMAKQHIEQQQQLKYSSKYSDLSSKESVEQVKMGTIEEDQGERARRHTSSAAAVVAISPPPRHPNALQHHTSEVIADLLDLEIELSSIQAGIHQMEKMTPSDPFGPGATTPSASLHIPPLPSHLSPTVSVEDPFGDSFVSATSSSLSTHASKRQTEPSMATDTSWFDKPEDLFAEEAGAGREQENTNGTGGQQSDSGKAEERSTQFDVFTELDPLGTGRSRPYIDKKDFFQDLKNPPKKVLRDLVTDTPSVTPPSFPSTVPLFNAMFDDASFFPTESVFPSPASLPPSSPSEDPFADTDPFLSSDVSGIFPRIEDDPFDTDFANLSSSRKKRVDSATVGRKPRKGITHGPLRVSLPPEKKDSPVLLPPPPTATIPRSRSRSPRSLASPPEPPPRPDSAPKPPPLPPKRVPASQYEFIDQYETRATVDSQTVPRKKSVLPPPPRRQRAEASTPPATSFDITLAELGKMSIADLATALCIPPERVSTMTLQELAEKLSACRSKSEEEEYAKRDRYAALRDDDFASVATFSVDFEAKFEEEFNKEDKDDVFREVSSFDKYAVFRELIDSEKEGAAAREDSPPNEASDGGKEEEEEEKAKEEEEESSREEAAEDKYAALREICVEEEKGEAGGAAETNSSEEKGVCREEGNSGWANFAEEGGESEAWSSESREAVGAWGKRGWRRSEEEEEERRRPRRSRKAAWVEERRCWEEGMRRRQRARKPSTWGDEEDEGEEEEEEEDEEWRGKKRRGRREWEEEEERGVRRRREWDRRGKSYRSWDEEDEAEEDYEEEGSRRCRRVRTASGEGCSRTTSRHFRHEPEERASRRRTTPFSQRKTGAPRWRREEEEEEEERWGRRSGPRRQRGKEVPVGKRTVSRGSSGGRLQSPFEDDFVHGTGGGGSSVSSDVSERSPVVHNGRCSDDVFLPSFDAFPETNTQRPFSAPVEGARNRARGGARASASHRMQRQQSGELGNGGLRKSESVNIFARDSDPFDDDFFSSGNAGRGQKTSSSADPFKWTEPFGHYEFREEEEDDEEEGERVTAAGQAD